MRKIVLIITLLLQTININSQNKLIFHTEYLDTIISWFNAGCPKNSIDILVLYPESQIMEQLLINQEKNVPLFKNYLIHYNPQDSSSGSKYLLNEAYIKSKEIAALINKIKESDFSDSVYSRVLSYFPEDYTPTRNYEVYFTATGWKWGDAMSFSYNKTGDKYAVTDTGTPAIIFNLTIVCNTYGKTLKEQMDALQEVMSHELFHAILSDYTKTNWISFNVKEINNNALMLIFDEGIAHYISQGKILRDRYKSDNKITHIENKTFITLSDSSKVIFNPSKNEKERLSALNSGLYGKYWDKYISMTGFFMAYHIDQYYGVNGLKECVKNGPTYFIKKYELITIANPGLPKLPKEITSL